MGQYGGGVQEIGERHCEGWWTGCGCGPGCGAGQLGSLEGLIFLVWFLFQESDAGTWVQKELQA